MLYDISRDKFLMKCVVSREEREKKKRHCN